MKKSIKILLSFIMAFIISFSCSASVFAASASVKIDSVDAYAGQEVALPVYIENNPGLSGTKITVNYDKSLQVISVEKGKVFSSGNFVQNADNSTAGSFDIVWNSSVESKENGVIFTVTFKLPNNASGDYNINISYDKDNTFNARYEDVTLDCDSAVISVPSNGEPDTNDDVSVWKKIVAFFEKIFEFIVNLFK